ncbi:hypothetical protein ATK36_1246 [Amycolatopsis sulphurea]|uniref:Uncharacterized protein n=1 Tax=Amycolatopsis sulphurea TaxID=76022 RepID=A0A2A9FKU8_9PSEU|nr:hypothetical protein [Amycolatopsis sulphurea]PFG51079.1 hypothetical protein ATK36_6352 [Amycolatopsis sulphurea]PFG57650.1 hypothetical protein ATK36_1246 [Amycolatopsis sulphurea]
MRIRESIVMKLARLHEEFYAIDRTVINPEGGRNRKALLQLADLASEMVQLYEEGAAEMRREAHEAYDLATGR